MVLIFAKNIPFMELVRKMEDDIYALGFQLVHNDNLSYTRE
jgi:hypothetical protein